MRRRAWFLALSLLFVASCASDPLMVLVRFRDARGLDPGAPVMIGDDVVGKVVAIRERDDRATVHLSIEPKHAKQVTEDAQFRLARRGFLEPEQQVVLVPGDGDPVEPLHRFVGQSGTGDVLDDLLGEVRNLLDDPELRRQVRDLGDDIDEALQRGREEWERAKPELERELDLLMEEAERTSQEAAEVLRRELERLRQALEEDDGAI